MTGGELKIEVLPPLGGPGVRLVRGGVQGHAGRWPRHLGYHYGKQNALALWNSGPMFGMDATMLLAWHSTAAARHCCKSSMLDRRQMSIPTLRPNDDAASRLVQETITKPEDFKGSSSHQRPRDRSVHSDGCCGQCVAGRRDRAGPGPRLLDGAEFNNATSDRILGFPMCPRSACCRATTRAPRLEISFNKTKFDALPAKMKAIIDNAVEAASSDVSWKAIDRYSKDYVELQTRTRSSSTRPPIRCCSAAQCVEHDPREEVRGEPAVQGDRRIAEGVRRARREWDQTPT